MSHNKEYKDLDSNKNRHIEIVNFTFDDIRVYKTDMDNSKKTHYWFVKNSKHIIFTHGKTIWIWIVLLGI